MSPLLEVARSLWKVRVSPILSFFLLLLILYHTTAADLVLLNDISAIVDGVLAGRLCFENLKKTCLYLLPAGSFSELMVRYSTLSILA